MALPWMSGLRSLAVGVHLDLRLLPCLLVWEASCHVLLGQLLLSAEVSRPGSLGSELGLMRGPLYGAALAL